MPKSRLARGLTTVAACLPLLGFAALAGSADENSPDCEYKGVSPPDPVKENVGRSPSDPFFFTTFSDVEDVKGSTVHEYVRVVYNRSPKFLLPFEWPQAGLSYKELGTVTCTSNSFTSSLPGFQEIRSRITYGPTGKESASVPMYASRTEVAKKPDGGGGKVEGRGESPPLRSRFVTSSRNREEAMDVSFTSATEGRSINYSIGNRSVRPILVSIPALTRGLGAVVKDEQGRVEYGLELRGEGVGMRFVIPAESPEERNRITVQFGGPFVPAEQVLRASVSDSDGRPIGAFKVSVYLPVAGR